MVGVLCTGTSSAPWLILDPCELESASEIWKHDTCTGTCPMAQRIRTVRHILGRPVGEDPKARISRDAGGMLDARNITFMVFYSDLG